MSEEQKVEVVEVKPHSVKRGSVAVGIKAIAEAIGVREATIRRLSRQKKIPYVTAGLDKIYNIAAVEAAFELMATPDEPERYYECANLNQTASVARKIRKQDMGKGQPELPMMKEVDGEDSPIDAEQGKEHLEVTKVTPKEPSKGLVYYGSNGPEVVGDGSQNVDEGPTFDPSEAQEEALPAEFGDDGGVSKAIQSDEVTWF